MNKVMGAINEKFDWGMGILWSVFGLYSLSFGDNMLLGTVQIGIGSLFLCTDKIITHLKRKV